jgi:Protein of unknown function (DUF2934)
MPENREPADAAALRRQVQERAYALWEGHGGPHGRDVEDWLKLRSPQPERRSNVKPPTPTASPAGLKTKAGGAGD